MNFRKLHLRIATSFALLLLVLLAAVFMLVNGVVASSAEKEIGQTLAAGERIFGLLIENNRRQLVQSASILSSDFAFREAIATGDRGTMQSALGNHGARIKAEAAMLVDLGGKLTASTLPSAAAGQPFPFPALIGEAQLNRQGTAMVVMDENLYQLVAVPVLAPLPIAWLVLGFHIDDRFAAHLRSLTGLEVSFVSREGPATPWRLLATTLAPRFGQELPAALASADPEGFAGKPGLRVGDEDYLAHAVFLNGNAAPAIDAVLQRSLQQSLEPLRNLQKILLALGCASLTASLAASLLLARNVTRPIAALADLAGRIARGDYSERVAIDREDEIGQLAFAFNHMREGISAREARITNLAYRDQLTGLPNRTLFAERLEEAIHTATGDGQPFALLLLDLNRFKEVNEILGHQTGDLLLQNVAERLEQALLRQSDTVARLGGDEFVVLLPGTDLAGAQLIARRLLEVLDQPLDLEEQKIITGGSIGIVAYPEHGKEASTLMRHADLAMYAAKGNRGGCVCFEPALEPRSQALLSLLADLRQAVEGDELVLFYQPKICLATGTLGQVEALVRWRHPKRGLVPPAEFIPFAENTGYIQAITRWALEAALRQRRRWESAGLPLAIAVNISAQDLMNVDLPEMVGDLMARYGASPDWISIEITESTIMGDPARALGILHRLHNMGLRLAVDDFGTGYSSLAYLKKLPVAELKIDQSFVTHMARDPEDATIVRSTIDLGHNMGLKVVAEGVENEAVWNLLRDMGCDLAQGYYLSRPLEAEALDRWIDQSSWIVVEERKGESSSQAQQAGPRLGIDHGGGPGLPGLGAVVA